MGDKKDRGRFSIKFNENDPAHRMVIEVLERQGARQKAQFLANAVLHYIHCSETPDLQQALPSVDRAMVESVVLEILKRQGASGEKAEVSVLPHSPAAVEKGIERTEGKSDTMEMTDRIDEKTLRLISSTMAGFRNQY